MSAKIYNKSATKMGIYFWNFRDALRWKSLWFSGKLYEFGNKNLKRYNFETANSANLKFTPYLGHI